MKIVRLQAENYKRLKAVDITPKNDLVKISGDNEQGKTSILDAIWAVISEAETKKNGTEKPIRNGEKSAKVTLDLGEFVVTRKWTEKTSTLEVRNPDGSKPAGGPQAIVDKFMGKFTLDPMALCNMKPADLKDFLLKFVDFDYPKYEADRKATYEKRTIVNRDLDVAAKALKARPALPEGLPEEEVPVQEVMKKISAVQAEIRKNDEIRNELVQSEAKNQAALNAMRETQRALATAKAEAERLEGLLEKQHLESVEAADMVVAVKEMVAELKDPDQEVLKGLLQNIEITNANVREKKSRLESFEKINNLETESKSLTEKIEALDKTKDAAFLSAKLPVEGLKISEDSVLFKDVPFSQCSSEEKLRVSIGLAMLSNPKLKVLRIKDASLIGKKQMAVVEEMIRQHGFQAWCEQVDDTGKIGFYIEDGEVKAENP